MSLHVVRLVGRSVSRVPVYLVRCSRCRLEYRRCGWKYDIARNRGCSVCSPGGWPKRKGTR
jgi:hypothetical protein